MKQEEINRLFSLITAEPDENDRSDMTLQMLRESYDFSPGFTARVLGRIHEEGRFLIHNGLMITMNRLFIRIALSGAAAIILLVLSVYLSGGDLSFDTLLGLGNSTDEGMITLLSGNF